MTAHEHHHHHHHGKVPGGSTSDGSAPKISATGKAAPPPPPPQADDASGAVGSSRNRRRHRRPTIGPEVWAAFKEEQKVGAEQGCFPCFPSRRRSCKRAAIRVWLAERERRALVSGFSGAMVQTQRSTLELALSDGLRVNPCFELRRTLHVTTTAPSSTPAALFSSSSRVSSFLTTASRARQGVTRTLLGLPDEETPSSSSSSSGKVGDNAAPTATPSTNVDENADGTIEQELQRRRRQQQQQQQRAIPRTTLGTFMAETRARSPDMEAMLPIMKAVGKTCTAVSRLVRRAQIEGMAGLHQSGDGGDDGVGVPGSASAESVNVQGEVQKELDVLSNSIFLTGFCQPSDMSCVASEEEETPRMCATVIGEEMHG